MVLDFQYGINTGNRFLDLVDHDEDPDEFIAGQTQSETKAKQTTKDSKTTSSATSKKTTNKATPASTTNVSSTTTKSNKENASGKPTNDQRRPQSGVSGNNNQQQQQQPSQRFDSGRGGGRGFSRRGAGSAGQERPAYEGGGRGGGQQRSQRFTRFEGQQGTYDTRNFEQGGEAGEQGDNNQGFRGYSGRGRGAGGDRGRGGPRGTFYNRNYEGGRGRGRGRGGRGYFNNRTMEEGSQQQEQQQQQPQQSQPRTQEDNEWHPNTDSSFDNTRSQPTKTDNQELDIDPSLQERAFEPDGARRGGRGQFRSRTFRSNRSYGQDNQYQHGREGGQEDYRQNRRQHDRQPRSFTSTVKPIEKKDGEGAHNWGNAAEIPDEQVLEEELNETGDQGTSTAKGWAEQVDEAEKKQITLDEYKKQLEEKKRAHQEKLPQLNPRTAGEGEDQKNWQFKHEYRKKNDNAESDEEEEEESGAEEDENEDDEGEQHSGKKKLITIPLRFKPVEIPRGGPFGSRGGQRRGGGGRFQDRPYRDDQQRSKSPNQQQQQQQSPVSPQTGEYQYDDQQQRSYRGGPRQGSGRGEYRRSYGNSNRGSRGGYNRANANPNTPDLNDTRDFPTLST